MSANEVLPGDAEATALAEAERWMRHERDDHGRDYGFEETLLAEYDRRGAELERRTLAYTAGRAEATRDLAAALGMHADQPHLPSLIQAVRDLRADRTEDGAELRRLSARVAELEAIERRADETSTWCGDNLMHRAVRYIRTGRTGDFDEVSS